MDNHNRSAHLLQSNVIEVRGEQYLHVLCWFCCCRDALRPNCQAGFGGIAALFVWWWPRANLGVLNPHAYTAAQRLCTLSNSIHICIKRCPNARHLDSWTPCVGSRLQQDKRCYTVVPPWQGPQQVIMLHQVLIKNIHLQPLPLIVDKKVAIIIGAPHRIAVRLDDTGPHFLTSKLHLRIWVTGAWTHHGKIGSNQVTSLNCPHAKHTLWHGSPQPH
mmetsp:Transcript_33023/g.77195  ORF Transcript_33023/g.77195 Transcript_33023/m.77195 type:complete len:217 (+) Transcript_33023:1316-1966(+)